MSLKDSAIAVLRRNQQRNHNATQGSRGVQLNPDSRGRKVADPLTAIIEKACRGLDITSEQFRSLITAEDYQLIIDGNFENHVLRAYAESFNEGIRSGRIKLLREAK